MKDETVGKKTIPNFFKPILWSYNFAALDPEKHKRQIIVNTLNYGNLKHWQWISTQYGIGGIEEVLRDTPSSSVRKQAFRLASLLFHLNLKQQPYALRSTRQ